MKNLVKGIVFDEFFNEGEKLTFILKEASEQNHRQLGEKIQQNIENKLGVKSFEEFLDKFAPTIYPVVTQDKIEWTLENNGQKGIKLNLEYKPLKVLLDLMDSRKKSSKSKLEFNWQDSLQAILPSSMVEDAKRLRRELELSTKEIENTDKTSPRYIELAKQIKSSIDKIRRIYEDNPLNLLPLAINDCEKKLESLNYALPNNTESNDRLRIGYYKFNENGEVKFEENTSSNLPATKEDNPQTVTSKIQNWLEKDYCKLVKSKNQPENPYIKNLIVSNFSNANNQLSEKMSIGELKKTQQTQIKIYKKTLEGSFNSLNKIFTKLLGVRAFFEQNPSKEKPMLIIANEKITELVKEKKALEIYLKSLNRTSFSDEAALGANIWLGIIPGIVCNGKIEESIDFGKIDDLDDFINGEYDQVEESNVLTSISAAKEIMELLKENEIITFFNFEANKNSTFEELQKYGLEKFKNDLETLKLKKSPYFVPCYPNFSIIDEQDFKIDLKAEKNDNPLYLQGVYIDSSYVAAGLVTAYLEPKNLLSNEFGFNKDKINLDYPGVRINLEEPDFGIKIKTSIAKESNFDLITETKQEIRDLKVGFIFICNEFEDTMFTFLCRSTDKNPIYRVLTADYVKKLFMKLTKGDPDKIKALETSIIRDWTQKEKDKINVVLKENDSIEIDNNSNIEISFNGDKEKPIKINLTYKSN